MTAIEEDSYPPAAHVLRDLRVEFEQRGDGTASAWLPAVGWVRNPSGSVHAGVLATLVDLLGGGLAAVTVQPDWIATADLTLHVLPRAAGDEVRASATVIHAGRRTAVMEVELGDDRGPLGLATMSFARLPRRDANPVVAPSRGGGRATLMLASSGLSEPIVDRLGFAVRDPARGVTELAVTPYVSNSLGAVQGGVLATAAAVAADAALSVACDAVVETCDLQVTYLALAKVGPVCTRATMLEATSVGGTCAVEVLDGDRVTTTVRAAATVPA
ncbi:MAG TPA: PaaI family thioesterase [Acidimicrobiia bacterium]|nr:PaaI family thioesterase [Acidimicrobiia bacterium]